MHSVSNGQEDTSGGRKFSRTRWTSQHLRATCEELASSAHRADENLVALRRRHTLCHTPSTLVLMAENRFFSQKWHLDTLGALHYSAATPPLLRRYSAMERAEALRIVGVSASYRYHALRYRSATPLLPRHYSAPTPHRKRGKTHLFRNTPLRYSAATPPLLRHYSARKDEKT